MSLLDEFPHRCTIQKLIRTSDSLGGSKDTPITVSTLVECWEQQASNSEIHQYQKRGIVDVHKIFFHSDPGVDERYEIVVTHKLNDAGNLVAISSPKVFEVISQSEPDASAGFDVVWRVMVRYISGRDQ